MAKYKLPVDKHDVASGLRINLGPDTSSRQNGSVGGEMVKKTFELVDKNKSISR
jgi:hypothetical protein